MTFLPHGGPLFLTGFMACGKSTLARALARKVPGLRVIDLDEAIEVEAGCSVSRFFETHGEEAFRRLESDVLRRVSQSGCIVACGGGTPCRPENMSFMLDCGTVVWLRASVDITIERLRLAPGQRPKLDSLLNDTPRLKAAIESMLAQREQHYARAHAIFDANRLDTAEQIEETADIFINRFFKPDSNGRSHTS